MAWNGTLRIALLLALGLLCSCGLGGEQNRPTFVDSYPAEGQALTGPLQEIRLTYDEAVTVLNPADVRVFARFGGFVQTTVTQRVGDPNSVYVRPTTQPTFPVDDDVIVQVAEGAVQNGLRHYAADQFEVSFSVGVETPLLLGEPGLVTLVDPFSFASVGSVPTPGSVDPVAVVSTIRDTDQRVWVQLADGGGIGESLAWFTPGDVAMVDIDLTAVADLTASTGAMTVGPDGRFLYAAFRDTDAGSVRLVKVDTATALEAASLELTAVPTGASTDPVDLQWSEDGTQLIVCAQSGATTGTLAFVDHVTFTEVDKNAGVLGIQGFALPNGAGPFVAASNRFWVNRPGSNDLDVLSNTGTVTPSTGTVTGTITSMFLTPDGEFIVEGLSGYTGNLGFQTRKAPSDFTSTEAGEVLDDVGGADLGSDIVFDLKPLPGTSRFVALLGTAGGRLLAFYDYAPHVLFQVDLDGGTAGVQVADVDAAAPGAYIVGRTYGAFAP